MDRITITHFNEDEFIEISNRVNEQVCKPIAEAVADEARALADEFSDSGAYRDSIHVEVQSREAYKGNHSWARSKVVADVDHALKVESKHGTLAKALGSL